MDELEKLKKELTDLLSGLQGTGSRNSLSASSQINAIAKRIQELEARKAAAETRPGLLPTSDESE